MKYFFDNCLSHKLVSMLQMAGWDDVIHLQSEFKPNTEDVEFMPTIAERGWWQVTGDLRQRSRPEERKLREALKLTTIFFGENYVNLNIKEQSWRMLKWWPDVLHGTRKAKPGQCFLVSAHGKINPF